MEKTLIAFLAGCPKGTFPLLLLCLWFVQMPDSSAQVHSPYSVRYLGLEEGLQEKRATSIYQSKEGRLWIGTINGLFVYDGIEMAYFGKKSGSEIALLGSNIRRIQEDDQQHLWILTEAGLEFIDPASGKLVPRQEMNLPDSIFQEKILSIDEGKPGEIIMQAGWSIYKYRNRQLRLWYSIPRNVVLRGHINYTEKDNGVYIYLNANDLFLLNKDGLQNRSYPIKMTDGTNRGLLYHAQYVMLKLPSISDNLRLCATPGIVLNIKFQGGEPYYELSESNRLEKIFPPWQAVLDYVNGPDSPIKVDNLSFFINEIKRCEAGLWILGTSSGVFLVQEQLKFFRHLPGTDGKPTRGMLQSRPGQLLIASAHETIDYDLEKQTGRSFSELPNTWNFLPLEKGHFLSCVETFYGLHLLHFYAPGKVRIALPSYSKQFGFTRSMAKTPHGIWAGNLGRNLFFLPADGKSPEASPYNDSLNKGELVNAILYSPRSGLWAGCLGRLYLFRLDPQTDRIIGNQSADLPLALQKIYVNALYESEDGKIWIGCNQSGGLYAYDPKSRLLQHWDLSNGLCDNTIYSILGSNSDSLLWIGTQYGLSRMNVAAQSFRNFYSEDGLEQNEFNTASSYRSPDGTFYFGGLNGISYFRPEWIPEEVKPIQAYLKISVLNLKSQHQRQLCLPTGQTIELDPDEQYIQLDIRSNELFEAAKINGRYRIEGIQNEWQGVKPFEKITLAGLRAGKYQLTVQVQAPNDAWSAPFDITLKVFPFWYNTWWFRTLIVLAIATTLYFAYQLRIRQIKKEYDMRKQISDDLHDDLGSRIFMMMTLASQISKPQLPENERRDIAERFENLSKNVMGRMRDFIWTFNPQNDGLSEFLDRLEDFAFVAIRPVVHDLHFERDVPADLVFASPARHHILMVFQEILTNMVKHTHSQKIIIKIWIKAQHLHINIVNAHLGFQKSSEGSTNHGITSIEKRMQRYNIGLISEDKSNTQAVEISYNITNHV